MIKYILFLGFCSLFFLALGPLFGGIPFNLLIVPIPFSYLIGSAPATLAGLLFGIVYLCKLNSTIPIDRVFWGAISGTTATILCALALEFLPIMGGHPLFDSYVAMFTLPVENSATTHHYPSWVLATMVSAFSICSLGMFGTIGGAMCGRLFPFRLGQKILSLNI